MCIMNKPVKSDLERLGIFKEMGYISIGDEYKNASKITFNESAGKGKQMLIGTMKSKAATCDGYFEKKFSRAFDGEATKKISKPTRDKRPRSSSATVNAKKPFLSAGVSKKASGLGSYYGCISGPPEAMSFASKVQPHSVKKRPKTTQEEIKKSWNCCGHPGSTFVKSYEHMPDEYDTYKEMYKKETAKRNKMMLGEAFKINLAPKAFFEENPYRLDENHSFKDKFKLVPSFVQEHPFKPSSPAKKKGGMNAGCLNPFPPREYSAKQLQEDEKRFKVQKNTKSFHTSSAPKSTPIVSILAINVDKFVVKLIIDYRSINSRNYRTSSSYRPDIKLT